MKTLAKFLCVAVLFAIPAALLGDPGDRDSERRYRPGRSEDIYRDYRGTVRILGTVKKINDRGRKLEMTVDGRTQKVGITDRTDVYSDRGRKIDAEDLRNGDGIRVEGYRAKGNEIVAEVIHVAGGYVWQRDRYSVNGFSARVLNDTSMFNRKLKVSPQGFNGRLPDVMVLDVPKDARIIRDGRQISVHEIRTGDMIRVEGHWSRDTFHVARIEVDGNGQWRGYERGRDYRGLSGRIDRIDYQQNQFTLSTDIGQRTVYADRARVWDRGEILRFEDLRRGDRVMVRGNIDGRSVDAERIDIGG